MNKIARYRRNEFPTDCQVFFLINVKYFHLFHVNMLNEETQTLIVFPFIYVISNLTADI